MAAHALTSYSAFTSPSQLPPSQLTPPTPPPCPLPMLQSAPTLTKAGLAAARARGRKGGRPFKMTPAKLRLAQAAMGKPETVVADLCAEIGITPQTLYRFVDPKGELRAEGKRLLGQRKNGKPE